MAACSESSQIRFVVAITADVGGILVSCTLDVPRRSSLLLRLSAVLDDSPVACVDKEIPSRAREWHQVEAARPDIRAGPSRLIIIHQQPNRHTLNTLG